MPKRAPYFPFYPIDWLHSESVSDMNLKQRGMYITLLCHEWIVGKLPVDDAKLWRCLQVADKFDASCLRVVKSAFDEKDGFLYNPRLEEEREKLNSISDKRKEAILKRWSKTDTNVCTNVLQKKYYTDSDSDTDTDNKALKDLVVPKSSTTRLAKSDKALSTRVKEYYAKTFEEINEIPPVQFSASDAISINANVKRLVKNDAQTFTFDFFCGLIDHCFTWGCSGLAAMLSENSINGYIQKRNAPTKTEQKLTRTVSTIQDFIGKGDEQ